MSDVEESSSNSPCETEEQEEDCTNIRPHKYEPAASDRQPSMTAPLISMPVERARQSLCGVLFKFRSP